MQGNERLAECGDPAAALRVARELVDTVTTGPAAGSSFWPDLATQYLAAYLHAAALSSRDMHTVARWARGGDPHEPEEILTAAQAPQWSSLLGQLRSGRNPQTAKSVRLVMQAATDTPPG